MSQEDSAVSKEIQDAAAEYDRQLSATASDPIAFSSWREASPDLVVESDQLLNAFEEVNSLAAQDVRDDSVELSNEGLPTEMPDIKEADLPTDPKWVESAKNLYKYEEGEDFTGTDQEASEWATNEMSAFNWNTLVMSSYALDAKSNPQDYSESLLYLIDRYDTADISANSFGRALKHMAYDPITYAGAGVGAVVGKKAGAMAVKAGVKKALQAGITVATAGAIEGGALSAATETGRQSIAVDAGAQDEMSGSEIAVNTGAGVAAGTFIGLAGAKAAPVIGAQLKRLFRTQDAAPIPTPAENIAADVVDDSIELTPPKPSERTAPTEEQSQQLLDDILTGEGVGETGRSERRNINLDLYENEDTQQVIELVNRRENGYLDTEKRKVKSHAETIEGARVANKYTDIIGKPVDSRWNTEDVVMLGKQLDISAKAVHEYAKKLKAIKDAGSQISDEQMAHFNMLDTRLAALQELMSGVAADAGRLLNSFQAIKKASNDEFTYYQVINDSIKKSGGRVNGERRIDIMAGTDDDLAAIAKANRRTFWERSGAMLLNIRYNMMLSSIRTHMANISGSTLTGAYESLVVMPTKMGFNNLEALVRSMTPGLTKMTEAERLSLSGYDSMFRGQVNGLRDGLRLAGRIIRGKEMGEGKIYNDMGIRYDVSRLPTTRLGMAGTLPTRALEAEDAIFRTTFFQGRIHQLAEQAARAASTSRKQFKEMYADLLENPTKAMLEDATLYSKRLTFTADPSIYGTMIGSLAKGIDQMRSTNPVIQMLVPFVNTPANLLGYAMDQTGLGNVTHLRTTVDMLKGTPEERADVAARITIAIGLWALVNEAYESQTITGTGPSNYNVNKAWQATGWRPNSIKLDGKYYELNRMDPLGLTLGIIASTNDYAYEVDDQAGKGVVMTAGILSITNLLKDRAFLSGLTDATEIISSGSIKAAQSLVVSTGLSYVTPNFLRDFREIGDDKRRSLDFDPNSDGALWNRARKQLFNAVPGLSPTLPAALDWKGDPIVNIGQALYRGIVPIKVSDASNQDAASAVLATNRVAISKPDFKFKIPARGATIPLNLMAMDNGEGHVYAKYQEFVGKARHEFVSKFINSKNYTKLVAEGDYGPYSLTSEWLGKALSKGLKQGKVEFLKWLAETDEFTVNDGQNVVIEHGFSMKEYKQIAKDVRSGEVTEEGMQNTPQFVYPKTSSPVPDFTNQETPGF